MDSEVGKTGTLRQQLEQHRVNPNCAVCHNQMDPIGFGLENYNAVGTWRTLEGKFPIDTSGRLPDGKAFTGPKELREALRARPDAFTRNLTEKLLTYALGRGLEPYDSPVAEQISGQVAKDGHKFSDLVLEIVKSAPFQLRRGDPGR
jgi:hypothetical protein